MLGDTAYSYHKFCSVHYFQLTDVQITEYLQQYDKSRYQMAMFFQLRIALSPAIEAIILLDRCLYLLEQVCRHFYGQLIFQILPAMKWIKFHLNSLSNFLQMPTHRATTSDKCQMLGEPILVID